MSMDKKYTWDIKSKVMGKKESESSRMIVDLMGLPMRAAEYIEKIHKLYEKLSPTVSLLPDLMGLPMRAAEYIEKIHKLYEKLSPTVSLLPGADKLVRHLHKHKVTIAVVTGSDKKSFALKSRNYQEFFSLFDHLVLSGCDPEVQHGKPAPDAFLIGAQRFPDKPDPSKVLVFEDAPNGVEAAHAAGMMCVWIPHAELDSSIPKTELVIDSLEQFQPQDFGLPPYDS